MINKVEHLTSIGKFRAYLAAGQVNFKKLTLVYGDNGGGKTTLTSVFRSLTTNNPEIIRSRISTNHSAPQAAQITQAGTPNIFHTFGATGWTVTFPDIEIFDIHFVNDNVYSGFEFNDDHRKQLHQFVIGAQGIAIQNQIEQNKASKTTSRQNQTNIEQQLIQLVGNNLTPDLISSFLRIPITEGQGIDPRITVAEAALLSANSNAVIQTLQTLSSVNPLSSGIDFSTLISDLQATSESIQNTALETLFSNHCQDLADNNVDGPERWLQKGFSYVREKQTEDNSTISCPFCKQSIDSNVEIITAYTSKFNLEFNALVERLQSHKSSLQNFNLDAKSQALNTLNQTNTDRITSWSTHLPSTIQAPTFNVIPDETLLKTEFENVKSLLEQKIQNPTTASFTTAISTFETSQQTINTNIGVYNQAVSDYNAAIATFRSNIQSVVNAQLEVNKLKRIKS